MATDPGRRVNPILSGGLALGAAAGLGALVLFHDPARFTSYGGRSEFAAALMVIAGLCLLLAGWIVSRSPLGGGTAPIAILAGVLWFAPTYEGWTGGPTLVRSFAMLVTLFLVPLLLHIVLTYPSGAPRSRVDRGMLIGLYGGAAVVAVGLTLFRDPYHDPSCWSNCTDNAFLIHSLPGIARMLSEGGRWFAAIAAVVIAAVVAGRLIAGPRPRRRALAPIIGPAVVIAAAAVGRAVVMVGTPLESPSDPTFFLLFVVGCVAAMGIGGALAWGVVEARRQRLAVAGTIATLGEIPIPGTLGAGLAAAVGDPELRIAYVLTDPLRYVDASGVAVDRPLPAPGRSVTTLVRDGRPIAVVTHAAGAPELETEIGMAVRLGLENERLQAEVLAHLESLRASRARIVEEGDAERRRLERDLHDGAQQRLLALSYDIRVALSKAEGDGEDEAAALLRAALERSHEALAELRELAHGIYPAVLFEAGLAAAVESAVDAAPIPVAVAGVPEGRYPPAIERAAYLVVTGGIEDATRRGASIATVDIGPRSDTLVITVDDDGSDRRDEMTALADRVGAAGGRLAAEPTSLRADIPCA